MTPGEIFLTVFVAFLAGATVYLGFTVRELQQQIRAKPTYAPPDPEREAHEAMKARSAELQAAKLATPESDAWPYEWATDPGAAPPRHEAP